MKMRMTRVKNKKKGGGRKKKNVQTTRVLKTEVNFELKAHKVGNVSNGPVLMETRGLIILQNRVL